MNKICKKGIMNDCDEGKNMGCTGCPNYDTANRFKFRVWDNKLNAMYEVVALMDGGGAVTDMDNGEIMSVCHDGVIMQSTGMCDAQGREIYEGDIVEFGFDSWTENGRGVIEHNPELARLVIQEWRKPRKWKPNHFEPFAWWVRNSEEPPFQVIGNRYENP